MPKAAASVYNWLIGDWAAEVYDYEPDGAKRVSRGEWHFSWVLEGRAIQDVWIVPERHARSIDTPGKNNRYGTTLRIYDPKSNIWRVFWFNPVTQNRTVLVGRQSGKDIVQQGFDPEDGTFVRWTFKDITPASFVWDGESSQDGGKTWQLGAQFVAHR